LAFHSIKAILFGDHKLTTASGIPYYNNEDTMSTGHRGPLLLQDLFSMRRWRTITAKEYAPVPFACTTLSGNRRGKNDKAACL